MNPILSFVVILIGVFGLANSKNVIKSIFCVSIIEAGTILLFLNLGVYEGGMIPIFDALGINLVDPLPQALMVTTIVIGSTITSLALMISVKLYHHFGSIEWKEIFRRDK